MGPSSEVYSCLLDKARIRTLLYAVPDLEINSNAARMCIVEYLAVDLSDTCNVSENVVNSAICGTATSDALRQLQAVGDSNERASRVP